MRKFMKDPAGGQMSDALINNMFLALSGGFQDAYTYFTRNGVFSNAQTGNVVLMSQHLLTGEWIEGVRYVFPLLAFALGIVAAEQIKSRFGREREMHWRQAVLLVEMVLLFLVGFLPHELDMAATALVSFTCAMQVQAFRKIRGYAYASTMCIGNLRSGMEAFSIWIREKDPDQLRRMKHYFGVIFCFAVGAGAGGNLSIRYGIPMIWVSCMLLAVSFLLMFQERT